jgi:hypothetical protein
MTTIGTTTIQTVFAVDYIDMDYGYIGGFYSIGLSGPAFGGGNGYMMLRLPNDVTIEAKDFPVTTPAEDNNPFAPQAVAPAVSMPQLTAPAPQPVAPTPQPQAAMGQYIYNAYTGQFIPLPTAPYTTPTAAPMIPTAQMMPATAPVIDPNHVPAPNVKSIIKYNHPAKQYDEAQELARIRAEKDAKTKEHMRHELERRKKMEQEAIDFGGAKVFPLPSGKKVDKTAPSDPNSLSDYAPAESRRFE